MIAPVVEQLAQEFAGRARVCKVDVDRNPRVAAKFGVQSIPTLIILKNGREIDRLVGAHQKTDIARRLERAIAQPAS
jgi:thioredoxin-like negative regulator of GroEL